MNTVKTTLLAISLFAVTAPTRAAEPTTDLTQALAASIGSQVLEITDNLRHELTSSLQSAATEFVSNAQFAITASDINAVESVNNTASTEAESTAVAAK